MKRSLNLILAAAMCMALFSGCNDKNVSKYIPDSTTVDSTTDNSTADNSTTDSAADSSTGTTDTGMPKKETEALDTVITDYKYDFWSNSYDGQAISDKYIYFEHISSSDGAGGDFNQDYKIDLQTGEMIPLCNVPQCHHSDEDKDCESFIPMAVVGDKGYACKNTGTNSSRTIIDESGNVVLENTVSTELSLNNAQERINEYRRNGTAYIENEVKYDIGYILTDGKNLYITGTNYIYAYDIETKQTSEPIIIDENFSCYLLGADMENKRVYFFNYVDALYMVDLAKQTVTKVGDGSVDDLKGYNGKIYYARLIPRDPDDFESPWASQIFEADPDFTNEKMIIDNCANNFVIKDDKIFYFDPRTGDQGEKSMLHSYDMKTGKITDLFAVETLGRVITAPHIDRIFVWGQHYERSGTYSNNNDIIASFRPDGSDIWTNEVKNQETLY